MSVHSVVLTSSYEFLFLSIVIPGVFSIPLLPLFQGSGDSPSGPAGLFLLSKPNSLTASIFDGMLVHFRALVVGQLNCFLGFSAQRASRHYCELISKLSYSLLFQAFISSRFPPTITPPDTSRKSLLSERFCLDRCPVIILDHQF